MYSVLLVLISLSGILGSVSLIKSDSSPWITYDQLMEMEKDQGVFKPAYGYGKRSGKSSLTLKLKLSYSIVHDF